MTSLVFYRSGWIQEVPHGLPTGPTHPWDRACLRHIHPEQPDRPGGEDRLPQLPGQEPRQQNCE